MIYRPNQNVDLGYSGRAMNDEGVVVSRRHIHIGGVSSEIDIDGAMAITNGGLVVGIWDRNRGHCGAKWKEGVGTTKLENLYQAIGANDKGIIVGQSRKYLPCLLEGENLTTFPVGRGVACSVNDIGQVVGTTEDGRGFLYQGGEVVLLDQLLPDDSEFVSITSAKEINEAGQIIGQGVTKSGKNHAYFMAPVPLSADLNGDGSVDFFDQAKLSNQWLRTWKGLSDGSSVVD